MAAASPVPPAGLRVVDVSATTALATLGPVVIVRFRTRVDADAVVALRELLLAHAAAHPAGIGMLDVVEERTTPPNDKARAEFARGMRELQGKLQAAAVVSLGNGLFASVVRSVVTGLVFLVKPRGMAVEVVRTVDDGCAFLAEHCTKAGVAGVVARELAFAHDALQAQEARLSSAA